MRKLKIQFVLKQPYPIGLACTKRVHLYAKGLQEVGQDVSILIPRASENEEILNKKVSGQFEGICYRYTSKSTIRSRSFMKRRISDFVAPLKSARIIIKSKPDVIFLVSPLFYHAIVYKITSYLAGAKFVKEKNEIDFMHQDSITFIQKVYLRFVSNLFDAFIVITENLQSFYRDVVRSKVKTCVIPILVNFSEKSSRKTQRSKKLVYTGTLLERKDGIITILRAFARITGRFPEYKLYITGNVMKSKDYYRVLNEIKELSIREYVVFTGRLSEEKLRVLMNEAEILLLAKPRNRQNEYNFPTKVGEYLATGNPILLSNIGETNNFLVDGKTAFICDPKVEDFAIKMEYILKNYEYAMDVARNGFYLAQSEFYYKTCMKKMAKFLGELTDSIG